MPVVVVIIVVAGVAALIGAVVGYFWGRSDERNNGAVEEQCAEFEKYDDSEKICTYRGAKDGNTYLISIPKPVVRHFELATCPQKARICWRTEKGAASPSITQMSALP